MFQDMFLQAVLLYKLRALTVPALPVVILAAIPIGCQGR
jgi:hypothetical protein